MPRFLPFIFIFIFMLTLIADCLHAGPDVPEKSAEGERLDTRIDAQARQIATMTAYSARLRRILARAGLPDGEVVENLSPVRKMQRMLPRVRCNQTRLVDAIGGLARVARIDIAVDWKSLAAAGIGKNTPVTCDLGASSVSDALRAMLAAAGFEEMAISLQNGAVEVYPFAQIAKHVLTRAYDVKATLSHNASFVESREMLEKLVTDTVAPESWQDAGGTVGTITFKGRQMLVTQTPENLDAIDRLLEELDIDKKNEHRQATIDEQEFQIFGLQVEIEKLTARCRSAGIRVPPQLDRALNQVLPDVEFVATPLHACFDSLRHASGQVINVHWKVLQEAGLDPRMPITMTLRQQSLAVAVQALIREMSGHARLQYGTEDNAITVSTQEEFDRNTVTRVYDIRDLPIRSRRTTRQEAIDEIVQAIITTIEPDSWRDAGGMVGSIRELQGQLIVTQTDRAHARIKAWLDARRHSASLMQR